MNEIKLFIVIDDKQEERDNALEAIKRAFVSADDEIVTFDACKGAEQISFKNSKVMVQFASDLVWALKRILFANKLSTETKGAISVRVLTDLMFPAEKHGKEEPNGLGVLAECITSSTPVVVCSDTDHHDVNYLKNVFPILGKVHPKGEIPIILDKKDWDKALQELDRLLA